MCCDDKQSKPLPAGYAGQVVAVIAPGSVLVQAQGAGAVVATVTRMARPGVPCTVVKVGDTWKVA